MSEPLQKAVRRILSPLIRLMIARGFRFTAFAELAKDLYIEQALRHFRLKGRKMTDSRISVLTGLQRKDIRGRRSAADTGDGSESQSMGPLPRVLSRWATDPRWRDAEGRPLVLPRKAATGPSFEQLVAEISRDIHPRTVLDQLLTAGAVAFDERSDDVRLLSDTYLARDDAQRLAYLGANLGDHAEAAAANLMTDPSSVRFFERAVHYNRLSPESLASLDALARRIQGTALSTINEAAQQVQDSDRNRADAPGRFRCGVFIYRDEPGETS